MDWNLATDNFTLWDRLKVAAFALSGKQLTMGKKVAQLEKEISELTNCYALSVSNGSIANTLIFERYKNKYPDQFKNTLVICPAVSWISTISPAIMSGFQVEFCDINLVDLSFDYKKLEEILYLNSHQNLIIWPTSLISRCPNFNKLRYLAAKYKAKLYGDFCEDLFSTYNKETIFKQVEMSSLSCYFSHCIVSVEMGFVLFRNKDDYEWGKLWRNHGLIRSLEPHNSNRVICEKENSNIDPQFLYATLGTNARNSDAHAVWGLQDIKRVEKYKKHRKLIYDYFISKLDKEKYYILPNLDVNIEHYAFCLPFFRHDDKINEVKKVLNQNSIQTRPIIGGCLTLQPPFQKYHHNDLNNALWVHNHGAYCGLNYQLKLKDIDKLTTLLNNV